LENAVAWYMLMDNRISGLDLQSVPGFPFGRPRDKLDIVTRKEPSGEAYNYFTSPSVLRSASRILDSRSENERSDINEFLDIGARKKRQNDTVRCGECVVFVASSSDRGTKIKVFVT